MMNGSQRTPAKTRTPCARAALLVVDPERDRLARRRRAGALLLEPARHRCRSGSEKTQSNDELLAAGGERRRIVAGAVAVSGRSRKR